jgi:hypothetical protein
MAYVGAGIFCKRKILRDSGAAKQLVDYKKNSETSVAWYIYCRKPLQRVIF